MVHLGSGIENIAGKQRVKLLFANCWVGDEWFSAGLQALVPDGLLCFWVAGRRERRPALLALNKVGTVRFYDMTPDNPCTFWLVAKEGRTISSVNLDLKRLPVPGRQYRWERNVKNMIELVEGLTAPGDYIVDICAGHSSLGIAAIKTGRKYEGWEIIEDRVKEANRRLNATQVEEA